jgi:hypothetical protein
VTRHIEHRVFCGIDTVAIGGVATSPIIRAGLLKRGTNGVQTYKSSREGIRLFVTVYRGITSFRLETSLPHLVLGENFRTINFAKAEDALRYFLTVARRLFPELAGFDLYALPLRRLDIAFDFPVAATPLLINAMRDCYLGGRDEPGFVYNGCDSESFFSKDTRGKRPPRYRSLICYPKGLLPTGEKGLRIETRFFSHFINTKFKNSISISQLKSFLEVFLKAGWKYIEDRFRYLAPHDDESLEAAITRAPAKQRDFLRSFGFLSREVPLKNIEALFKRVGIWNIQVIRKHGIGYGDMSIPELRMFAEVREVCRSQF